MTEAPVLRVITPNATPAEIAAIVAVVSSLGSAAATESIPKSAWADPARRLRTPMSSGWRHSSLPG